MKYLYGASVQGIQNFIFQTSELQDVVGASELVEKICTDMFLELLDKENEETWIKEHKVVASAGNVKYILDEEECRKAVREFPRKVMKVAPGITISQAAMEYDEAMEKSHNGYFAARIDELEKKLRAQRNYRPAPVTAGLLGMERARNSGLPAVDIDKDRVPIDASTKAKKDYNDVRELAKTSFYGRGSDKKLKHEEIAYDVSDITDKNDWIAIIHADGNSLGQVVQKVGGDREKFAEFSEKLDEATVAAANDAFKAVSPKKDNDVVIPKVNWKGVIPIRPVVLGGDDMTVIIRGSLAIDYVKAYLEAFENRTKEKLGHILTDYHVFSDDADQLTACAGVAFIKSSYPFYYGYNLAEELCEAAKKTAKEMRKDKNESVASCLMFHKVQDSFVRKYSEIVERELSPKTYSLKFGPYYINEKDLVKATEGSMTIKQLLDLVGNLDSEDAIGVRSGIRRWLTLVSENSGRASQHLERLKEINDRKNHKANYDLIASLTTEHHGAVPAYDCLTIYTILNQVTKED